MIKPGIEPPITYMFNYLAVSLSIYSEGEFSSELGFSAYSLNLEFS